MGSSKRSKDKDRKKRKKDRSRSRDRNRHRHHHKHKKHKRTREELSPSISLSDLSEFEPDYDAIPIRKYAEDSTHPPPAKIQKRDHRPVSPEFSSRDDKKPGGGSKDSSLSIEETNRIRAKLGLKLLEVSSNNATEQRSDRDPDVYIPGEEIHKPPENIRDKLQVDKLREKIAAQREKRRLTGKLKTVKNLGDSDGDDSAAKTWVTKSRKMEKERKEAEKKNKMLEELDEQFGVGDLIEQEIDTKKRRGYSSNHLSGLKVQHDTKRFADGQTTILTLKDSNILEGDEDTLQNVDLVDLERAEKNVKLRKSKKDTDVYDAPLVDDFGNIIQKELLMKYDEEIGGPKNTSFRIGKRGVAAVDVPQIPGGASKNLNKLRQLTSLATPENQLANEYLTPSDMTFKKIKRKKRKKKMLTADDLEALDNSGSHFGAHNNRTEEGEIELDSKGGEKIKSLRELMEEDEDDAPMIKPQQQRRDTEKEESDAYNDDDIELQEALARSRRAKLRHARAVKSDNEMLGDAVMSLKMSRHLHLEENKMTLNLTDEFCRSLGDIPTYGLSGNRADEDAVMDDLGPSSPQDGAPESWRDATGAWEEVDIEETKVEIANDKFVPILEEEPDTTKGIVNALKLAVKKGYLEKGSTNKNVNATLQHLRAINYSIDDKSMDEDRRSRNNDRYMGPTIDFKEKDKYRPDVKLEYVDDEGRKLNAKEAFRYLSHKFHGKGSGKNKLEKRMKKWQGELLLKSMSSIDTPLQTLERQREKQKQLGMPFLVLSGSKPQELLQVKK